ncbi:unnamed protein product (macronuclear) [Paramecium tetraurelia]|uniref:RBR-type E3 ubiquitin transferase n=1 Tax=Paramecium tetraurelia TaxID=5888 RepID=A0CJJ1_PARTE|nr:uncharacterized protein GSPATT00000669001 [Paramecium tetraurelia]CAK70958.1 unnamed protein product [Paramecium tetraurelia]|eukprot:XP_001438355.1 hypothetical protein (macronuclear) [Paramecium tetraurelia strain d4-2]
MQQAIEYENESQQLNQCPICQEYKGDNFDLECKHRFCRNCLEQYLNVKIDEGIVMHIRCPSCSYTISYEEVVQIIQKLKLAKFEKFRTQYKGENNPSMRHCPNKSCDLYVLLDTDRCICGQEICKDCGNESHGFSSCNKLMDEIFVLDSRQEKIQRCPKCKIIVQKEGGCNHMTCKRCQYQFCWICRRQYTSKHYNNYNYFFGCPNKQYTNTMPWKYPKLYQILPFVLLFIISPLLIALGILLLILHPFSGSYYLFNRSDNLAAVGRLSRIQMLLISFFVYFIGGIVLYPFVVLYECILLLVFLLSLLIKFIKSRRNF